ncbi:retrovirus-related pol polyprotein from transposon TNT 1-94, partial [Tanacetum coccineum]
IKREYNNARTPQQSGVNERKNKTLIEAVRTMLADSFLPNTFLAEAVSTACYVLNRVLVTKPQNNTPYELRTGKVPIISYIRPFGCHVTILNTIDHLGKFDGKSDEGFLVGYSLNSKDFRPVRSENQANKTTGPKEANHSAGTQDHIDAGNSKMEVEPAQDYFVLPIWSSYTSIVKSSEAKNEGKNPNKDTDLKTNDEPVDQEDQVFLEEFDRLKRQEKESNNATEALRKEFAQDAEDLLLQAGAARATSMYERQKKPVQDFIPIGFAEEEKLIEKMNDKAAGEDTSNKEKVLEEPDNTKVEVKQEGNTESTRKRPGRRLKMKATKKSKRQKIDSDLEEEEQLKAFLMIVPDEEGEINYEVLNKRNPIVDRESKFYHTDRYGKPHDYYRVFRVDGSSRYIKTFTEMVSRFDTLDFIELHSLVMKRFKTSTPEGINLILWGIHILVLKDGTEFYMLAERRYPLSKETFERMLALRLIAESESEAVFDLLRFIQIQIDESRSHDGTCYCNEALAIPEQMTTGKEISNPVMADWKPKNAKDDKVTKEFKFIKEQIKE